MSHDDNNWQDESQAMRNYDKSLVDKLSHYIHYMDLYSLTSTTTLGLLFLTAIASIGLIPPSLFPDYTYTIIGSLLYATLLMQLLRRDLFHRRADSIYTELRNRHQLDETKKELLRSKTTSYDPFLVDEDINSERRIVMNNFLKSQDLPLAKGNNGIAIYAAAGAALIFWIAFNFRYFYSFS